MFVVYIFTTFKISLTALEIKIHLNYSELINILKIYLEYNKGKSTNDALQLN